MGWLASLALVGCTSGGDSPADTDAIDTSDTTDTIDTSDTVDTTETGDTTETDTDETAETDETGSDTGLVACLNTPGTVALGPTTSTTIVGATMCGLLPLDGTCLITPDTSASACGAEPRDVMFYHLQSNDTYRVDFDNWWMFVSTDPVQPPTCGGTVCSLTIAEGTETTIALQHVDTDTDRSFVFAFSGDTLTLTSVQ